MVSFAALVFSSPKLSMYLLLMERHSVSSRAKHSDARYVLLQTSSGFVLLQLTAVAVWCGSCGHGLSTELPTFGFKPKSEGLLRDLEQLAVSGRCASLGVRGPGNATEDSLLGRGLAA